MDLSHCIWRSMCWAYVLLWGEDLSGYLSTSGVPLGLACLFGCEVWPGEHSPGVLALKLLHWISNRLGDGSQAKSLSQVGEGCGIG